MKIAYDTQIFNGQVYGGISRYICELASRIEQYPDVDVKIVAPLYINAYLENLPKRILKGFSSPFPNEYGRVYQRVGGMIIGDLMLRCMNPDIVHETYYLKRHLGPKSATRVLTIHDMIHEKFESQLQYGRKVSIHKAAAAARADHIICVSESTKRDVIEILGINSEKISVIPLGANFSLPNIKKNSFELVFTYKPYLLYVGNRGAYKNFKSLLEAYASSKLLKSDFNLVCFGGGVFNTEEIALIHKLGLELNSVKQISGNDLMLAELYTMAYVFVFPSLYEGFGIPPLEAMYYGCPVVCANTSSIPEVVGDAGQYFDPYDIESIQISIEKVVCSQEFRVSLIHSGTKRLKNFSWDKCASQTFSVYKALI